MSLINDALNKVQQQRRETVTARAMVRYPGSPLPNPVAARERTAARTPAYVWMLVNVGVVALAFGFYHFFIRDTSPPAQPAAVVARAPASRTEVAPGDGAATTPVNQATPVPVAREEQSPFVPPPAPAPESAPLDSEFDLAGMSMAGKTTLLSITRRSDQKSFWVPVGKTVGEVTAVSYDPVNDNARIRVRGRLVTIGMRNAALP